METKIGNEMEATSLGLIRYAEGGPLFSYIDYCGSPPIYSISKIKNNTLCGLLWESHACSLNLNNETFKRPIQHIPSSQTLNLARTHDEPRKHQPEYTLNCVNPKPSRYDF